MASHPLARHVTVILLAKVLALTLLYALCFAPAHRPHLNDSAVADALLGTGPRHVPGSVP
jgi:hypothetical protein